MTVTAANDAPTATPQTVNTPRPCHRAYRPDPEDSALTFDRADGPAHGPLPGTGSHRRYTPTTGYPARTRSHST